ncbi:MAG: hypothetical protein Q8Q89_04360 [bacterium]|nr:hypothetical protein [bacterium]
MDPEELESLKRYLSEAIDNLEEEITLTLRDAIESSVSVAEAWKKVVGILAQNKHAAHIVVERAKVSFMLYPFGTGESKFMLKSKLAFTEKDRKEFKDLGIKLDP